MTMMKIIHIRDEYNNALDEATVVRDCNNGWPVATI